MAEQVFEIDPLKKRALELLRDHGGFMALGSVATGLGVPVYAAQAALDAARLRGEVEHAAASGWRALDPKPVLPAAADVMQGGNLWTQEG
jgi:hypothetical protein